MIRLKKNVTSVYPTFSVSLIGTEMKIGTDRQTHVAVMHYR